MVHVGVLGIIDGAAGTISLHICLVTPMKCSYMSRALMIGMPGASAFRFLLIHYSSGWMDAVKWIAIAHA